MAARAESGHAVNAGPTAERVYETLKRVIMERGFRPGDRLDPALLAEQLNSSTTPVREALDRLVGEDLVESRTGSGFHVPALDEPGLKDMYAWCAELLHLSVRGWPRGDLSGGFPEKAGSDIPIAEQTAQLFAAVAGRSLNSEHGRALGRLNARLHAVRTVEPLAIAGSINGLESIEAQLQSGDRAALRRAIATYHRPRIRGAAAVVRALYRAS
jgi:DNA-binding FadR family transcriptional regulator